MTDAIRAMVRAELERKLKGDIQEIMNAAIESTLEEISQFLVVKFVESGEKTFRIEFTWKGIA